MVEIFFTSKHVEKPQILLTNKSQTSAYSLKYNISSQPYFDVDNGDAVLLVRQDDLE